MKWIALVAVVVLSSAGASAAQTTEAGPRISGALPAQALLVAGKRDTLLVGLDGRVDGRIVGVRPPWTASGSRNEPFLQLSAALPNNDFVVDRTGGWFLLEPSGRLRVLPTPEVRLPDGVVVTARPIGVTVTHNGRVVRGVERLSGSLAIAQSSAVDLVTGVRWPLSSECYAVGLAAGRLLELCGPSGDGETALFGSPKAASA